MKKNYPIKKLLFISGSILLLFIAACKKDKNNGKTTPVNATPKKIGFYEVKDSIYKICLMNVSMVGTQKTDLDLVFDTGSGGMVLDASEVLPASAITSTGFSFTGDSTVVDGITITNQTDMIEYGDDDATTMKVYGNLCYAPVTIGDNNGNITVKRIPFFMYYKATDSKGNLDKNQGDFDVFGVSSEYDIVFGNGAYITSPFSYYDPGTGLTKGFKMDALGTTNFSEQGTYVPAVTLGLTTADLTSNGYSLITLNFYDGEGYLPIFPAKIAYGQNAAFNSYVLFDTGTEPYSYLQDPTAANNPVQLASGSSVVISLTGKSFTYNYKTADLDNLTFVENSNTSGSVVSVISLSFFETNSFLLDFQNNQIGLKAD